MTKLIIKKKQEEPSTNKVFQTICGIKSIDQKKLVKFMKSPYFNQSEMLTNLCLAFIKLSEREEQYFVKEKIWSRLFPEKPYNDISFRKACSDLLELVELFLGAEIYFQDAQMQLLCKIQYVTRQKIEVLFRPVIQEHEKNIINKSYFTQLDYYHNYQYEKKYHKLMDFDVRMNQKLNIEKISDNLDVFYLIDKLKILCNALVQKLISAVDYDLNDVESILKLCQKYDLEKFIELGIYYYSYQTLTDGDNLDHYFNLKKTLEKNAHQIPQEDGIEIFDTVLNYCIGRVNKGDKQFLKEYFDLFLNGIQLGIFTINGELAPWRLNNIIISGLRLGKIEWANQFILDYKDQLPSETRNNVVKFNMARVSLYKKDYENVLDHVKNVEYEDIIINLITKTMIVISYYELDEYETLNSFIETFRTFINRQKDIQSNLKKGYLNLLGFVRKLMRITSGDHKSIERLKSDIFSTKPTTVNQEWLLEKLEELRGNTST